MQSQRRQSGKTILPFDRVPDKMDPTTEGKQRPPSWGLVTSAVVMLLMVLIASVTVSGQSSSQITVDSIDPFTDSLAAELDSIAETVRKFRRTLRSQRSPFDARLDSLIKSINNRQILVFDPGATDSLIRDIQTRIKGFGDQVPGKETFDLIISALREILDKQDASTKDHDALVNNMRYDLILAFSFLVTGFLCWSVFRDYFKVKERKYAPIIEDGRDDKAASRKKRNLMLINIGRYLFTTLSFTGVGITIDRIDISPLTQPRAIYINADGDHTIIARDTILYNKLDALTTKVDSILNTRPGKVVESLHGKLDSIMRVDPNMVDSSLHEKVDSLFHHDFSCIDSSLRGLIKDVMDKIEAKCGGSTVGSTFEQLPSVGEFPTSAYLIEPVDCKQGTPSNRSGPLYKTYCSLVDKLRAKILKDNGKLVTLVLIGNADIRPPRGGIGKKVVTNSELAQRRAETVKKLLLKESLGIDTVQIVTLNSAVTALESKSLWPGENYLPSDELLKKERCVQVIAVWKQKS